MYHKTEWLCKMFYFFSVFQKNADSVLLQSWPMIDPKTQSRNVNRSGFYWLMVWMHTVAKSIGSDINFGFTKSAVSVFVEYCKIMINSSYVYGFIGKIIQYMKSIKIYSVDPPEPLRCGQQAKTVLSCIIRLYGHTNL